MALGTGPEQQPAAANMVGWVGSAANSTDYGFAALLKKPSTLALAFSERRVGGGRARRVCRPLGYRRGPPVARSPELGTRWFVKPATPVPQAASAGSSWAWEASGSSQRLPQPPV